MKVTNWRRKLAASLVAGGLIAPSALHAANLDTNLLVNPDFESVDLGNVINPAVAITGWTAGTGTGFAYTYALKYDNGNPLAGGGTYYFTPNAPTPETTTPGQVAQVVAVNAGATATQIAGGESVVKLSGFFSGYQDNGDYGHLHVEFLNGSNVSLGTKEINNLNETDTWRLKSGSALLPVGTASLRVSLFGTPLSGGPDGYIDNVDVRVKTAASELLFLEVNTTNGQMTVKNQTGAAVNIDYYEVASANNALNANGWNSLQEQNLAGFPSGNGTGNGWEQAGGSDAGVLGESFLTGRSAVPTSATEGIGLGAGFNIGGTHDLVFRYGALINPPGPVAGDYNGNGVVDAADYTAWRNKLDQENAFLPNDTTRGTVTLEDYAVWKANFGATGELSQSTLVTGFVRYVAAGAAATSAVPEPTSVILIGVGLASLVVVRRRADRDPS